MATVQPSSHSCHAMPPRVIIGSIVNVMPGSRMSWRAARRSAGSSAWCGRLADSVAGVVAHHAVAEALGVGLDHPTYDADRSTWPRPRWMPRSIASWCARRAHGPPRRRPGEERGAGVAVHAVQVCGDVDLDDVAILRAGGCPGCRGRSPRSRCAQRLAGTPCNRGSTGRRRAPTRNSCPIRSSSSVVTPGATCRPTSTSASAATRPARRMRAMVLCVLDQRVVVVRGRSGRGVDVVRSWDRARHRPAGRDRRRPDRCGGGHPSIMHRRLVRWAHGRSRSATAAPWG